MSACLARVRVDSAKVNQGLANGSRMSLPDPEWLIASLKVAAMISFELRIYGGDSPTANRPVPYVGVELLKLSQVPSGVGEAGISSKAG